MLFVVTKIYQTFDQHKEGGNTLMVIAGKKNWEKKQLRQKRSVIILSNKVYRSLIVQTLELEYIYVVEPHQQYLILSVCIRIDLIFMVWKKWMKQYRRSTWKNINLFVRLSRLSSRWAHNWIPFPSQTTTTNFHRIFPG